ncbi:MAG: polysaccharide pyruvyl transferase CsaB [Firmicutes bacterium]|nr:polysaccharide pyruvyl transferase CsaB [Bacillota bacterium]
MNILLFAAGGDIGGGKTHILSLANELTKSGNRLKILSFHHGVLADEAKEMGLDIAVTENGWRVWRDLRFALKVVDEFKPDVIHCHGAKANMMGVFVKMRRGVPIMTTVHSDPRLDYMGMPFKQYTFGVINAIALRRMDYYMAVAGRMEQNLIERGFDPYKIFTIHNGLDFSDAKETPRPPNDGDIVVGIAARLTPIKDISTVIKAVALASQRNPKICLRIAGTGEDEKELRSLAKKLNVEDRVEFVGWITDIKGFFSQIDINVLASLSETFPYSLLEGAYEHCPAVASRVGGIPSLITHGENGFLFEAGDVETFAEYIYKLSVDQDLRRTLAENLFQRAKNEFSLTHMREEQERAYHCIRVRQSRKGRQGAVICGAYGRGNAGDEAILKAILMQLKKTDPDMPFWVMTRNREETRVTHKVRAMYIFNVFAFIKHLRSAKIFVNGGGSLIQDVTSSRSLYFYLFTLMMAKACGCHVIMYGCGIGPINSARHRRLTARVLNKSTEVITLRDSVSLELLQEMKVDTPQILLASDPTVTIEKSMDTAVLGAFMAEGIPADVPKIGFCLRNWPTFNNPEAVAAAADYAYEKYGVLPVFIPTEIPKDFTAAESVTQYMKAPYHICRQRHSVEVLIGMLGSMKAVVGMRLHALIFATAGGAPVVGISYDIKVDSFLKGIGSDSCIPLASLSEENLRAEIDKAMTQGPEFVETAAKRLRQMERINIDAVKDLLEERSAVKRGGER